MAKYLNIQGIGQSMTELGFKVDTRLAVLLSENYRSSERALKELVDNAWDADAKVVKVTLPEPMSNDPIIIEDDGTGMTRNELGNEYLNIASNRISRRGTHTTVLNRRVKGRKGIGKFAGLMSASGMRLETWSRGKCSNFEFDLPALEKFANFPEMPLNVITKKDNLKESGTIITLSVLHQNIKFPCASKMRQLLIQEYGREPNFEIIINGKKLDIDDIQGSYTQDSPKIKTLGDVHLRFTVTDQKAAIRKPGIVLRVDGKTIGEPSFFGLDKVDDFPPKLLKKCFGEIEADGLLDDVTADWGALVEGSKGYQALEEYIQPILREKFKEVHGQEVHLAQARMRKRVKERLASMPEHKREFADKAITKVLERFYQEPESKVAPVVNVLLDAIERSDYRAVLEHINDAKHSEVAVFAEALDEFGLLEIARMAEQTQSRLSFLDYLEQLCDESSTLEKDVHKAIERNLWMFGPEYSLFSSNITLKRQIEEFLNGKYVGDRADKRPDILLNENMHGEYLLIEFKRPCHPLRYEDYQQATAYRNDFRQNTMNEAITVCLIGGKKGGDLPQHFDKESNVNILLFKDVISTARIQLNWLLNELSSGHV